MFGFCWTDGKCVGTEEWQRQGRLSLTSFSSFQIFSSIQKVSDAHAFVENSSVRKPKSPNQEVDKKVRSGLCWWRDDNTEGATLTDDDAGICTFSAVQARKRCTGVEVAIAARSMLTDQSSQVRELGGGRPKTLQKRELNGRNCWWRDGNNTEWNVERRWTYDGKTYHDSGATASLYETLQRRSFTDNSRNIF